MTTLSATDLLPLITALATGGGSIWVLVIAIVLVVGGIMIVTWSKTGGKR